MPHQREALKDIVPALRTERRLTTIMPCGTGKTMTQLWTVEAAKPKTVLVLLPSLALLRQTLHEWMAETKWNEVDVLCVCSDMTVGKKSEDEIKISAEDIGYPVTSDTRVVKQFLKKKSRNVKFVFSTYHSSPLVAGGMEENFSFDIAVFDEAHVTAGEEGGFFSFALEESNISIKVRTFWTATPRHYNLSKMKDVDGDLPLMYSMDDEEMYGRVVHKLTFRKAVEQGIICDYEVLVSVVTNKMLGVDEINSGEVTIQGKRVSAKVVAHHTALQQAIEKFDVKKIFSFHPRVADAEEFTNGGPQSAMHHLPKDFKVFHVNGEMTTAFRETKLNEFRHAKRGLMSNARCLTQGIDVPNVDLVAFFSKKRSLIDIVQVTGRAMRRAPGKTKGYILVPLYVEQGQGETLEAAVERSEFREVWAILNAMREQDEALAETMSRIRIGWGGGGGDGRDEDPDGVITVLGPQIGIEKLRSSITTICVDRLVQKPFYSWEDASNAVQRLKINTIYEYRSRYTEDPLLHSSPPERYSDVWKKNGGWPGFLKNQNRSSKREQIYKTWKEASKAARKLGFITMREYKAGYTRDPLLHSNPHFLYKDVWEENGGWPGFLGIDRERRKDMYKTWKEASKAVKKLNFRRVSEYREGYRKDPRLPSNPQKAYAKVWEQNGGWPGFLGKKKK